MIHASYHLNGYLRIMLKSIRLSCQTIRNRGKRGIRKSLPANKTTFSIWKQKHLQLLRERAYSMHLVYICTFTSIHKKRIHSNNSWKNLGKQIIYETSEFHLWFWFGIENFETVCKLWFTSNPDDSNHELVFAFRWVSFRSDRIRNYMFLCNRRRKSVRSNGLQLFINVTTENV